MPALRRLVLACSTMCVLASCGGGSSESAVGSSTSNLATTVKVTLSDSVVTVGTVLQATASVTDASGRAVTNLGLRWSVSDSSVASIDDRGAVMGKRAGNVTVTGQAFDATARVHASGTAGARVRWAPGGWYLHDSLYVAFRGSFGTTINVRIAGNRAAVPSSSTGATGSSSARSSPSATSRGAGASPSRCSAATWMRTQARRDDDARRPGERRELRTLRDLVARAARQRRGTFTDVTAQALPGQPDVNSWANDVSFAGDSGR